MADNPYVGPRSFEAGDTFFAHGICALAFDTNERWLASGGNDKNTQQNPEKFNLHRG